MRVGKADIGLSSHMVGLGPQPGKGACAEENVGSAATGAERSPTGGFLKVWR